MKASIRHILLMACAVLLICAVWLLNSVRLAQAQVDCPPGFHFDRLSGAGCVQDDCGVIANSHFDYTGHCVCNEGYSGCFEPINEPGYDPASCFPFCPANRLTSCVSYLATCPGEEPANTSTIEAVTEEEAPAESEESPSSESEPKSVKDLAKDLSKFLAGSDNQDLKSRDAAVAAAAAAAVMASWMAAQLAAGANLDDLKKAIKMVRGAKTADKTISPPSTGGGKQVGGSKDMPAKVPGVLPTSLPEQKKTTPQNDPASTLAEKKAPSPPGDPKENLLRKEIEKWQALEKTNERAKKTLESEHKSVSDTVRRLGTAFDAENITRCTDGVIEVGDTVIMTVKDIATLSQGDMIVDPAEMIGKEKFNDFVYKKLQQDVFEAYRKDLIKELLKRTASGQKNLAPEDMVDILRKPIGGNSRLPGGASKEVLMQYLKWIPLVGKGVSKVYDYYEQIAALVKENQEHTRNIDHILQKKKEEFFKQIDLEIKIHDRQVDINNAQYDRNKAEEALAEYLRSRGRKPGISAN